MRKRQEQNAKVFFLEMLGKTNQFKSVIQLKNPISRQMLLKGLKVWIFL